MFNGCKAHFRPTFTYKSRKWGLKFLQDIGYNVGFWGHSVDGMGFCDQNIYQAHDELGMGMFASMGVQDTIGARVFHRDEKMRKEFKRYNEEIDAYNAAAVAVVKKYGFDINDLCAVSATLPDEAHSDTVHYYTPMGTEAFTKQVLDCLLPLLDTDREVTYQQVLYGDDPIGI